VVNLVNYFVALLCVCSDQKLQVCAYNIHIDTMMLALSPSNDDLSLGGLTISRMPGDQLSDTVSFYLRNNRKSLLHFPSIYIFRLFPKQNITKRRMMSLEECIF
jgi:hypothetical protein